MDFLQLRTGQPDFDYCAGDRLHSENLDILSLTFKRTDQMSEEKASTPTVVGRNVGERRKFLMLTSSEPRYWSREALGQRTPMTAGWWKRVERDGQDVSALFLKALNEALQIPIQRPEDVYQILQRDFDPAIAPHPTTSYSGRLVQPQPSDRSQCSYRKA